MVYFGLFFGVKSLIVGLLLVVLLMLVWFLGFVVDDVVVEFDVKLIFIIVGSISKCFLIGKCYVSIWFDVFGFLLLELGLYFDFLLLLFFFGFDLEEDIYFEGGFCVWFIVFGSWFVFFVFFGLMNVMVIFDIYFLVCYFVDYDNGIVGGIIFLYIIFSFILGIYVGLVFDKYGLWWLIVGGSVCFFVVLIVVSILINYWYLLVVFVVFSGLGSVLFFMLLIVVIGYFFNERRGLVIGVVIMVGSVSVVVFLYVV